MKHIASLPAIAICCLSLSQCVVVEPGASSGYPSTPATSSPAPARSGYSTGYAKGMEDGRGGLSRTPARHEYLYSQADRSEFFRGYEAGYNAGIR